MPLSQLYDIRVQLCSEDCVFQAPLLKRSKAKQKLEKHRYKCQDMQIVVGKSITKEVQFNPGTQDQSSPGNTEAQYHNQEFEIEQEEIKQNCIAADEAEDILALEATTAVEAEIMEADTLVNGV